MIAELLIENDKLDIPCHLAIIMDGNGRWAKSKGLPRVAGHRKGAEAARSAVESSIKYGVRYLTLYSFSSENWRRPIGEINDIMGLLREYLLNQINELDSNGVRLRVIGERDNLDQDIKILIEEGEKSTKSNTKLDLIIALSYGSRAEIVNATKRILNNFDLGLIKPNDLSEVLFESYLDTAGIPNPDLLIRTSGEKRLSNFLLWQLAYTELVFSEVLWPDFGEPNFTDALYEFTQRERRFGKINSLRIDEN